MSPIQTLVVSILFTMFLPFTPSRIKLFSHQLSAEFISFFYFFKYFIYLFLERGEGREKERERNINVWLPLTWSLLGTWPEPQACALTGNRTSDPLVCRPTLNPLSYTSQGMESISFLLVRITNCVINERLQLMTKFSIRILKRYKLSHSMSLVQ